MKVKILNIIILSFCFLSITAVNVSTVEELYNALEKARPGQIILIAPGEYDVTTYNKKTQYHFDIRGTESRPITIKAQDPYDPPILRGAKTNGDFVIHVRGDYWVIENIKVAFGSKGIVLEHSHHNIFRNIEIFNIGSHAVNIRDGSSHNLFQNCYIYNTGLYNSLFGIGILIGLEHNITGYNLTNEYNVIERCVIKQTTSEIIKIKEYCNHNEIFDCVFYGEGINGKSEANSLIMISGSNNYIHNNVGYRNSNEYIEAAFEVKKVVENSGDGNKFENNVLFMDRPYGEKNKEKRIYVVDGVNSEFSVKNNKVDYGDGLIDADSNEFYNSDSVNFLK